MEIFLVFKEEGSVVYKICGGWQVYNEQTKANLDACKYWD